MWPRNVIVLFLLIHCITGYVLEPAAQLNDEELEPFSFSDIFDTNLRPKGFSPRWVSGSNRFYYTDRWSGNVMLHEADSGSTSVLISSQTFNNLSTGTYFMNRDLTLALFAQNVRYQWRHSFDANYKIQTMSTGVVSDFPGAGGPAELIGATLQYAGWNPPGTAISFVYKNNLYFHPLGSNNYFQVTTDGEVTDIFNGVPDWLYEEDVISERASHYWSPGGTYILYARINDTGIPFISWPVYGNKSNMYGFIERVHYPKAGDVRAGSPGPNSQVNLFVYDAANHIKKEILAPAALRNEDHYYLQVDWVSNTRVLVSWANRIQTRMLSVVYLVTGSDTQLEHVQTCMDFTETNGWLEVPPPVPWFINDNEYVTIHPRAVNNNNANRWRHLARVNCANAVVTPLTDGQEEIDYVYAHDRSTQQVYYSSTNGDSTERHIKRLDMSNNTVTCLTCNEPPSCRYITSSFSDSTGYYFLNCRGPEIPTYTLKRTNDTAFSRVFENNTDVLERLNRKALPTRQFADIVINGFNEKMELFTPPGHTAGQRYPLLIYAYAGPGSQRVMKTFPIGGSTTNWLTYLKSTHKIAIASLDSRGASGQGENFKFQMYQQLGNVEIQDQIALGRYFLNPSNSLLDIVNNAKSKAIFGWSYGGFAAAHVIGDVTRDVTCGISVAPVTTKMYYDTAYTERFLGLANTPEGQQAYNRTDAMNKVNNFRNKTFLIAHGIADDNVHFMHATQLIQALAAAGVSFRQNIYVDQDHSISTRSQSEHLYQSLTEFLLNDCWGTTIPYSAGDSIPASTPATNNRGRNSVPSGILGLLAGLLMLLLR